MRTAAARKADPTVYPAEDHMGETEWHRAVCILLWELARRFVARKRKPVHVGSNQFVYWAQHEPTKNLAPDLYVIPDLVVGPEGLDVVKTWEHGVPSLIVEVVSTDWRKDYEQAPQRCEEMGARELIVFDAGAPRARQPERVRWQVFRRIGRRGLVRVEVSDGDRAKSRVLGAYLREVGTGGALRLRIATGADGEHLVPSQEELLEAAARERDAAAREREIIARERDSAARERDAEREARQRAEAELAELRRGR